MPTNPITTETLAEGKRLLEAATDGPWYDAGHKIGNDDGGIAEVEFDNEHDVPLVVYLRNHAPALIAAAKERDRLRKSASTVVGFAELYHVKCGRTPIGDYHWWKDLKAALTPGEEVA